MKQLLCVIGIVVLTWSAAYALPPPQEQEEETTEATNEATDEESTPPKDKRVFTDKIVVTASRQEEESAKTPASITVIDREQIERAQPEKLVDLFKEIPGVEVTGEGPFRGLPVIRGFTSNRVLILVDGQRLNNARESTLFAGIQPGLVDLNQVERIEVLRGPASVLYGSDAMGGVINIITRAPNLGAQEFSFGGSAEVEYGENADAERARVNVQGVGEGFSFNIAGGYHSADDYYAPKDAATDDRYSDYVDEDGRVYNSGMKQKSFDGNLRWLVAEQGVLKVAAEVVRTSDIGFPGFDPSSGIDIMFPRFDRDKVSAAYDTGPLSVLDNIALSTYYQQTTKESRRNLSFGPMFFLNNTTTSNIDSWGLNAQATAAAGIHNLTFGLDFYQDAVDDDTIAEDPFSGVSTEVAVPKSTQDGIGLYVQDSMVISDELRVLAGIRGDRYTFKSKNDPDYYGDPFDVSDSDVSGNLGLVYSVTDHVELTALVGRGFRSPNLQERAYYGPATEPGYFILQNPDLSAERSLNYELGTKWRYDRYYGGLNLFYNDVSDLITFVEVGEDEILGKLLQYDNIDKATITGVEFELDTIFYEHWTAFTNMSYTRGDNDTEDRPLGFIPPFKVALGLRYQTESWWSEASLRWMDKQDRLPDPDEEPTGDFTTMDLRGGYDFPFGLSLKAIVANLFDKLYSEPFNNRPEPGRSYRVAASYRF